MARPKTASAKAAFRHTIIAEQLMADIRNDTYPVGSLLPPELELCDRFQASRHTVRQALRTLTERGFILRRASTGSVVVAKIEPAILVQSAEAMASTMSSRSDVVRSVLTHQAVTATAKTAKLLACKPGDGWYRLDTVSHATATGAPVSAAELYVIPAYAGLADRAAASRTRVSDLVLEMFDEVIERVEVEVLAGPMPAGFARRLKKRAGSPSLTVIRRYTGRNDVMFEVSVTVYPAEQHVYLVDLRRHQGSIWPSA